MILNTDRRVQRIFFILNFGRAIYVRLLFSLQKFSYLQGKMIGILQEPAYADSINSLAVAKAAYILGGNVAKVSANFEENDACDAAR